MPQGLSTLAFLILCAGCQSPVAALPEPPPNPPDAVPVIGQVTIEEAKIDALFAKWDKSDSPGCALAISKDGELLYARGYGVANLDSGAPITPNTVFRIASNSKQVTAAVVFALAEEGVIDLDADIRDWIPEVPDAETLGGTITPRHLIYHTSGQREFYDLMLIKGVVDLNEYVMDEVLPLVESQRGLNFQPGSDSLYCNTGYFLLAEIVARSSGLSLREQAAAKFFEPLGMSQTYFRDNGSEVTPHRAIGYERRFDRSWKSTASETDLVGACGVMSSVLDFHRWTENLSSGAFGGTALRDELHKKSGHPGAYGGEYAGGLIHDSYRGTHVVMHGGYIDGFKSQAIRFPEYGVTILCFSNAGDFDYNKHVFSVADLVLEEFSLEPAENEAEEEEDQVEVPDLPLADYVGVFRSEELNLDVKFVMEDGLLLAHVPAAPLPYTLNPTALETLNLPGLGALCFGRDSSGAVDSFLLDAHRSKRILFQRVHVD